MYEQKRHPPLPRRQFARRISLHVLFVLGMVAFSLAIGMTGYGYFENLGWRDGFLNSAMLLGGMGPVDAPKSDGGKLFAGFYALYAGLVFMFAAAILAAPILHRVMHKLHFERER
ncbi:MAG TPA: hypothetical protein VNC50_16820 [Planctomycetia bacterium]|nr:hypothetical protein [Planctomycetia bacterium]